MANKKITDLTAVATPQDTDLFETSQSGSPKKETRLQITSTVQTNLTNHAADATLHLTSLQNTWLDSVAATVTAVQMGYVAGVTSAIQTQLNTLTTNSSPAASPTFSGNVTISSAGTLKLKQAAATATLTWAGLTVDRAITLPDADGEITILGNTTTGTGSIVKATSPSLVTPTIAAATITGIVSLTGATLSGASPLVFEGATSDAFKTTFAITDPTAARTITFPDTTGTVLLNNAVTDYDKFLGIQNIIVHSAGTWTATRLAQGNYAKRKTAAADVTITCFDITEPLRSAANKGFKLTSFGFIYKIGTTALNTHTLTLTTTVYQNGGAVSVSANAVTGTLAIVSNADTYVTAVSVDVPLYTNNANAKQSIEITADAAVTSIYDIYGITLYFTRIDF